MNTPTVSDALTAMFAAQEQALDAALADIAPDVLAVLTDRFDVPATHDGKPATAVIAAATPYGDTVDVAPVAVRYGHDSGTDVPLDLDEDQQNTLADAIWNLDGYQLVRELAAVVHDDLVDFGGTEELVMRLTPPTPNTSDLRARIAHDLRVEDPIVQVVFAAVLDTGEPVHLDVRTTEGGFYLYPDDDPDLFGHIVAGHIDWNRPDDTYDDRGEWFLLDDEMSREGRYPMPVDCPDCGQTVESAREMLDHPCPERDTDDSATADEQTLPWVVIREADDDGPEPGKYGPVPYGAYLFDDGEDARTFAASQADTHPDAALTVYPPADVPVPDSIDVDDPELSVSDLLEALDGHQPWKAVYSAAHDRSPKHAGVTVAEPYDLGLDLSQPLDGSDRRDAIKVVHLLTGCGRRTAANALDDADMVLSDAAAMVSDATVAVAVDDMRHRNRADDTVVGWVLTRLDDDVHVSTDAGSAATLRIVVGDTVVAAGPHWHAVMVDGTYLDTGLDADEWNPLRIAKKLLRLATDHR